ncbi:DUF6167 family protein [Aeromicrobium stalagmiti]|uniref:DUF6167 family protein n=1 Tax=Aeromicrobium stalagmiti TaxID=2738988 RepID=UPI00156A6D8E|nr:DUF6167 family protein [Aeromicrobium stalagmiti]NRQ50567.1 hypothetical protein [Aeromicrobium stalagmiti]
MKSRLVWFVAGSAAGVYGAAKARRAAYRLSAPGVVDQAAALGLGWRAFSAEVQDGMQARERDVVRRLTADSLDHSTLDHSTLSLEQAHLDTIHPDKRPH